MPFNDERVQIVRVHSTTIDRMIDTTLDRQFCCQESYTILNCCCYLLTPSFFDTNKPQITHTVIWRRLAPSRFFFWRCLLSGNLSSNKGVGLAPSPFHLCILRYNMYKITWYSSRIHSIILLQTVINGPLDIMLKLKQGGI